MKPLAVTCGEPAGIGPEIIAKSRAKLGDTVPFFLIGDPRHLPEGTPVREITKPEDALKCGPDELPVLPHAFEHSCIAGNPDPSNSQGVIDVIARAVDLTRCGAASGVVTAPIHKKALQDGAGFAYPGHTEYLASLGGVGRVVMLLASDELRVVPTTIHIPLSDVPQNLTADLLEETLRITAAGLQRDFGISRPRMAVAGLNPHAGEGGKMGSEDDALIAPVVTRLAEEGMAVWGPLPADTMFHARARSAYDVAVCMYHDQALIPIKTLDFDRGVNVTLGLPFVRTSPDHGTAFDIAGRGVANPTSMIEAIKLAAKMAARRASER